MKAVAITIMTITRGILAAPWVLNGPIYGPSENEKQNSF